MSFSNNEPSCSCIFMSGVQQMWGSVYVWNAGVWGCICTGASQLPKGSKGRAKHERVTEREGERHRVSIQGSSTHQPREGLQHSLTATSVCVQTNRTMSFRLFSDVFSERRGYNGENVDKRAGVQVWQSSAALDPLLCIVVFNLALWANLLSCTGIPEYDRQKDFTPTEQAVKALCGFQRAVKWKAGFLPGQFQIMRDLEKMSNSIQGIPIMLWLQNEYQRNVVLS